MCLEKPVSFILLFYNLVYSFSSYMCFYIFLNNLINMVLLVAFCLRVSEKIAKLVICYWFYPSSIELSFHVILVEREYQGSTASEELKDNVPESKNKLGD